MVPFGGAARRAQAHEAARLAQQAQRELAAEKEAAAQMRSAVAAERRAREAQHQARAQEMEQRLQVRFAAARFATLPWLGLSQGGEHACTNADW